MSWRIQETHREESRVVKDALLKAGIDVLKVGHGPGTAWGWLHIRLAKPLEYGCDEHGSAQVRGCPDCYAFCERLSEIDRQAVRIAQAVTGRSGNYDGEINTHWA